MGVSARLSINGHAYDVEVEPFEPLLVTLRERLGLTGSKDGCSEGECGACTVLVDGEPIDSCLLPALTLVGRGVTTIEGIVGDDGEPDAIQEALIRAGAVQCGFCTPGFVMTIHALLARDARPSRARIREALSGNICRCTGYAQIVDAVAGLVGTDESPAVQTR